MAKAPKLPGYLDEWVKETAANLYIKTHSGTILVLTARIEHQLRMLIELHMTPLSSASREKIFEGEKAPLGTLYAKIEVARGLHLISAREFQALHALRDVRNKFAHSHEELHADLDDPDLARRFSRLPGSTSRKRMTAFIETVTDLAKSMGATHDRLTREKIAGLKPDMPPT